MELSEREIDFRNKVNLQISFPHEMRKEFIDYWTEPTPSGRKMRFEMEKTWDLKRRLHRWLNTLPPGKSNGMQKIAVKEPDTALKSDIPEVQELDRILATYTKHPTAVDFYSLGNYYEFMKREKLLKPLTQTQINDLREAFHNDNHKCRCACVQLTIQGYVDSGFTFAKVFELRKKLSDKKV